MTNVYDVEPNDLIDLAKEELKKVESVKMPEWALFVKTGAHKDRPPEQEDFWFIRGAALLRKIYTKGPVGISRLQREYGGRKNRGSRPEHHYDGGGKVIRVLLQQLEKAGYVKKSKKGREITAAGMKFLDNIAYKVSTIPKVAKPKKIRDIKPETEKIEKKKPAGKEGETPIVEKVKKKK